MTCTYCERWPSVRTHAVLGPLCPCCSAAVGLMRLAAVPGLTEVQRAEAITQILRQAAEDLGTVLGDVNVRSTP